MNERALSGTQLAPRLSIGVPIYNEENYLDGCLRSIVEQTFGDFEVIVCDNASTDRTYEIAKSWAARDPRIRVHRAVVNLGAAPNFNWAVELARGELFKWCAADDLMEPTLLERCIAGLDSDPDAVLAFSGARDIDAEGSVIGDIYDNNDIWRFDAPDAKTRFHDLICKNHSCIAVFGVIRTSALMRTSLIGPYTGSDRTLLVELGLQGKLIRTGNHLLLHREHEGRSVRQFKELAERTRWFDTRAKGPAFPAWRLIGAYLSALAKSPISIIDKGRCLVEVARFLKWYQAGALLDDLRYYFRGLYMRTVKSR